jgi:peptide/nickel transport system substrate-binding protein
MWERLGEHTFVRQAVRLGAVAGALVVLVGGCGNSTNVATPSTTAPRTTAPTTTAVRPTATTTSTSTTTPTKPARPNEFSDFKIAMDESTDYLDPGLADTAEGWGVMWNVYLPLIGYKHENGTAGGTLVPYLATALPTISANGRVYSLRLRHGLHYSDGQRVVASDFLHTIERDFILDSPGAALFLNIAGAEHFARTQKGGIPGIRVDDDARTIEIHLVAPEGDFKNILASEFAAPVPQKTSPNADTTLHPLPATGPYEIVSYQPHSRIVEVRNRHFQAWRFDDNIPAGNADRVTWDIVGTSREALHAVMTGKDDWMSYWPIASKQLVRLEEHFGDDRVQLFVPPNLSYFFMNTRVAPFDKLEVRQAVNYAISRKALVLLAGGKVHAHGTENILPPGYPSYRQHLFYKHNLRKAQRLVAESGDRGMRVTVWNHDVAGDRRYTDYLVSVLNKIGFHAHVHLVTASDYWSTLSDKNTKAQIGFANWVQDYPHPLDWFGVLLDGRQTTSTHNNNYSYLDVPWVNRRIESLTRDPNLNNTVNKQWMKLDRRVMRLAPWAPFLNRVEADFFSARVDSKCYVNNLLYGFDYASICVRK